MALQMLIWIGLFFINYVLGLEIATLRQILDVVRETYCGTIGVEFMHIQDPEQKSWIQERMEAIKSDRIYQPWKENHLRTSGICRKF